MKQETVFLSLGSNQGDSLEYLLRGILALARKGVKIEKVSSIYKTEPIGNVEQEDFLNMVIKGTTDLEALELLQSCQEIEKSLGRVRTQYWGPRTLDIDILFIGEQKICSEELTIPHPRMKERAFVLVPLQEIAPAEFKGLSVSLPKQKIILHIDKTDVKIVLKKRGLYLEKSC